MYDIIIIGGGPAGLTAGLYSTRARLKTLLIESYTVPSQAVITASIENYPGFPEGIGGFELIDKFKKQAENFGLEFSVGNVQSIAKDIKGWQVAVEDKIYNCLSLIIASGAQPKELEVNGEAKFRGRGVSYCATCDGALFRNKDIVVVGGGDTAVEEALFLTRFGKKVTLIHRRDNLRATKILQERALAHEKIDFVWSSQVIEILGNENVEAVKIQNIKTQRYSELHCDGVFIFVGLIPNTGFKSNAFLYKQIPFSNSAELYKLNACFKYSSALACNGSYSLAKLKLESNNMVKIINNLFISTPNSFF